MTSSKVWRRGALPAARPEDRELRVYARLERIFLKQPGAEAVKVNVGGLDLAAFGDEVEAVERLDDGFISFVAFSVKVMTRILVHARALFRRQAPVPALRTSRKSATRTPVLPEPAPAATQMSLPSAAIACC